MSLQTVNKNFLAFLLIGGLELSELVSFLRERKQVLLLAGAKIQNLPKADNKKAQVSAILKFPQKALSLLSSWVKSSVNLEELVPPETILLDFPKILEEYKSLESEHRRKVCRSALVYLTNADCPESLIEYFSGVGKEKEIADEPEKVSGSNLVQAFDIATLNAISSAVLGRPDDIKLSDVNPHLHDYLKGLAIISSGKPEQANQYLDALPKASPFAEALSQAITDFASAPRPGGLELLQPEFLQSSSGVHAPDKKVFAYCDNVSESGGGAAFIKVLGVIENGNVLKLHDYDKKTIFKETGEVIGFRRNLGSAFPEKEEIGLWYVEEFETEREIKYRLARSAGIIFEIHDLPFTIKNDSGVREWLKNFSSPKDTRPVFQLADDVFIRPIHEIADFTHYQFDEPFHFWSSLTAVSWNGRKFIFSPLPSPDGVFDCTDPLVSLRKVIKFGIDNQKIKKLTRNEAQDLVASIELSSEEYLSERILRLQPILETYVSSTEQVDVILQEIVNLPVIRSAIHEKLEEVEADYREQQQEIKQEIARLLREKEGIAGQIESKRKEIKEISATLAKSIKSAFERAKNNGIETLAQVALFEDFLGSRQQPQPNSLLSTNHEPSLGVDVIHSAQNANLISALRSIGLGKMEASTVSVIVSAAISNGLAISFKGSLAKLMAKACANHFSNSSFALIRVPLGLTDNYILAKILNAHADCDVFIFDAANLSPIESYASVVEEMVAERIVKKDIVETTPSFFFTIVDGPTALPVSGKLCELGPIIDTDDFGLAGAELEVKMADFAARVKEDFEAFERHSTLWLNCFYRLVDSIPDSDVTQEVLTKIQQALVAPYLSNSNN